MLAPPPRLRGRLYWPSYGPHHRCRSHGLVVRQCTLAPSQAEDLTISKRWRVHKARSLQLDTASGVSRSTAFKDGSAASTLGCLGPGSHGLPGGSACHGHAAHERSARAIYQLVSELGLWCPLRAVPAPAAAVTGLRRHWRG